MRRTASDDPRTLARDGLIGLGFGPQETDELLDRAEGDTRRGPDRRRSQGGGRAADRTAGGIRTPGVERVHDPVLLEAEEEFDRSLRPRRLEEFIGQDPVKQQLSVFIEAARGRDEALDHVLLAGPPGLGKTSLAQIVANELEVDFRQTAGPAFERKGDIASHLTGLEQRAVFFVDEIHRLPRALEETFYPAMEDGKLPDHRRPGRGCSARDPQPPGVHARRRHDPHRACSPRRCATASG